MLTFPSVTTTAHNIRNRFSKVFNAAEAIRAPRRWCLTGTPIQNSLDDYGALLSFIRVPPFETQTKFNSWIADPIKQRKDYAFKRLRALVGATCLRRTKQSTGNTLTLPKKEEVNQVLDLDPADRELYNFFKAQAATAVRKMQKLATSGRPREAQTAGGGSWLGQILPLISNLRLICDHGEDLLQDNALRIWRERDVDSVDWRLVMTGLQKCDSCGTEPEEGDRIAFPVEFACGHIICARCCAAEDASESLSMQAHCPECSGVSPMPSQDGTLDYRPSVKIKALLRNLASEHSTRSAEGEDRASSKRYLPSLRQFLALVE